MILLNFLPAPAVTSPASRHGGLAPRAWGKRPRWRREPLLPAAPELFAWRAGTGRWRKPLPVDFFLPPSGRPLWHAGSALCRRRGQLLPQAPHQLSQLRGAHLHEALRHRCRRRLFAGHQPRAHVARERQQLPGVHGGDRRHHRFQRERIEPPARRLLQERAEPVQRVPRQSRAACGQVPGAA